MKSHISGTLKVISLKFGMWSAEVGGRVHSKNRLVSSRQHRATEVRKLHFLSSCQYTHGYCALASWATRHTTVCLDYNSRKWYHDVFTLEIHWMITTLESFLAYHLDQILNSKIPMIQVVHLLIIVWLLRYLTIGQVASCNYTQG